MENEWKKKANCANMNTELFFPKLGENASAFVKEVCAECTVLEECLWYANETSSTHGIWGGMSSKQRELWRKKNNVTLGQGRAA